MRFIVIIVIFLVMIVVCMFEKFLEVFIICIVLGVVVIFFCFGFFKWRVNVCISRDFIIRNCIMFKEEKWVKFVIVFVLSMLYMVYDL